MVKFLKEKGGQYALVLLLTLALNFFLPRLMPGNPLEFLAGEDPSLLSPEQKAAIFAKYGLDKPVWQQFLAYLGQTARFDFGFSYQRNRPILDLISERLPWTLLMTGISLLLATGIGVALGAYAAWRRGGQRDLSLLVTFIFLESLPSFWVGMVLVAIFAAGLGWLPVFGAVTPWQEFTGLRYAWDVVWHLILPMTTLTIVSVGANFMIMRYSLLSVLGDDYVLMARAKGLTEKRVLFHHAMRNALLPVATTFILNLGYLVSGATVIETVFNYPGVGRLLYEAVLGRDYPVMQATFLFITLAVLAANLIADLVYPFLDPRVARGGVGHG